MLEIKSLTKKYHDQTIFNNLNLTFKSKGLYFIVGQSGCGKTTLFNLLGQIDNEYSGEILYNGVNVTKIPNYQGHYVSYLFQSPNLVNELDCAQNYQLPGLFHQVLSKIVQKQILAKLAISQLGTKSVLKISGGQKARVALMRTLMSNPKIILADEPTASLDHANGLKVLEFLKEEAKKRLVIVITHDLRLIDSQSDGVVDLDHRPQLPAIEQTAQPAVPLSRRHHPGKLALLYLRLDVKTNIKMILGIIMALMTIMITIVIALGLKEEVNRELNQLFGPTTYSARLKNQAPLFLSDLKPLEDDLAIDHLYLLLDEYELLGVGLKPNLATDEVIAVNDPTKAKPTGSQPGSGIVVSSNLGAKLNLEGLTTSTAYLYFSYQEEIKSWPVTIDGVAAGPEIVDSVYFNELAPIEIVAKLYHEDPAAISGSIVTLAGPFLDLDYLEDRYPMMQFKQVGATLKNQVNSLLDNINRILILFSLLSLVAALFLIAEIMYLSVIKNRRNLGIFRVMGATRGDLVKMILIQTFIMVSLGALIAMGNVAGLVATINYMVNQVPDINITAQELLDFDWHLGLLVYGGMLVVALVAALVPALIAGNQDVKKVLSVK